MTIFYIVESGGLCGGVRVIFEHCKRLKLRGHRVVIASLDQQPGWFDLGDVEWWRFPDYNLMDTELKKQRGKKIATWWRTAPLVKNVSADGEGYYFIQDIETSYYFRPQEKADVMSTYQYPLKHFTEDKWVADIMPGTVNVGQAIDTTLYRKLPYMYPTKKRALSVVRRQALKGYSDLGEFSRRLWAIDKEAELVTFGQESYVGFGGAFRGHMHGITDAQVVRLYSEGTVYVCASLHEGFCVLPDTHVWTDEGIREIRRVTTDNKVMSHLGNMKPVTAVMKREYHGDVIRIRVVGNPDEITLTPEHPVLCSSRKRIRGKTVGTSEWKWKRAGDLTKADLLAMPIIGSEGLSKTLLDTTFMPNTVVSGGLVYNIGRNQFGATFIHPASKSLPASIDVDDDFMYIAGVYVGDGCASNGEIIFCLSTDKENRGVSKRLIDAMLSKFGATMHRSVLDRNRIMYTISHRLLSTLFASMFGKGAHEKTFGMWVYNTSESMRLSFLRGLWDTDGTVCPNSEFDRASYSTVSKDLAQKISMLVTQLGVPNSISSANARTEYSVQLGSNNSVKLLGLLGYETREPKERAVTRNFLVGKRMAICISSIEKDTYDGYVYNLEVEGDNSYCTTQFAVHNCLPALEAMATGCPVATTECDGNYFCENEANCLAVPRGDPKALAEAAYRIMIDEPLRKRLVAGGLETAKAFSDFETVIDRLEEFLSQ